MAAQQPLVVIVGQTASGKTALAIQLAQKINGEVICADSRTVVQAMDIGTAKPTLEERAGVPHWGLDLVAPSERYTAAAFQHYAHEKVADIRARGKVPMLVGGTGLYVDGVVLEYDFPAPMTETQRSELGSMSQQELHKYCIEHNIELPVNDKNKRHLIRSIAHQNHQDIRSERPADDVMMFGIVVSTTTLHARIQQRMRTMFSDGVIDEARSIIEKYDSTLPAYDGVYPGMRDYLSGRLSQQELMNQFESRDRQLAKRQMTWFRRNPYIQWGTANDIAARVTSLFNSE